MHASDDITDSLGLFEQLFGASAVPTQVYRRIVVRGSPMARSELCFPVRRPTSP